MKYKKKIGKGMWLVALLMLCRIFSWHSASAMVTPMSLDSITVSNLTEPGESFLPGQQIRVSVNFTIDKKKATVKAKGNISGAMTEELAKQTKKVSSGSGSVFWDVTIPQNAPTGIATVTVNYKAEGKQQKNQITSFEIATPTTPPPPPEAQLIGMDTCVICHSNEHGGWLPGNHGNFDYVDSTENHYRYADFLSSFSYPGDFIKFKGFPSLAMVDSTCTTCHGPSAIDNEVIADLPLVNSSGNVDWSNPTQMERPVIGCESCHGAGSLHVAQQTTLPAYPIPPASQCGQCHNQNFPADHLPYHPNGSSILESYSASPHARSDANVYTDQAKTEVPALCSKCHTDEGAKRYKSINGNHDELIAALGALSNMKDVSAVQCRTCHDAHNPSGFLNAATASGSSEFNTCTNCHQLFDASGNVITPYHSSSSMVITDTHYDDPATQALEGYNVSKLSESSCANCHNPHSSDNTINNQWANSGHGDLTGDPWSHYDWKQTNRQSCQQCHTTTGFSNYANSPSTYKAADNNFSHLTGLQNEVLYCNGCHTDYSGTLRNPGAITAKYTGAPYTYPDVSGSNVCMACHTGRESGDSIKASTADFSNVSFINSHYLAAGGTVFTATGYEYTGRDYSNPSSYLHDKVGSSNAPGTGTNGPCVGCHMGTPDKHLFLPVAKDDSGIITAITSTACATCHAGGYSLTPADLEEENTLLSDAKAALDAQLQKRGFYFYPAHPYFYTAPYVVGGTNTGVKNWLTNSDPATGKSNMGAAFNYNLLVHDPGAYTHNRYYTKRLIYDAIDWLDDDNLNSSVSSTLNALPDSTTYKQGAITYVLSTTGQRP